MHMSQPLADFPVLLTKSRPGLGLLIATPAKNINSIACYHVVAATQAVERAPYGSRVEWRPLVGDGIFRMRNTAANLMLWHPDFAWVTHLLFVDSDILFSIDDVNKLIESGADLIGGCYPKRGDKLEYVINTLPDKGVTLRTGPQEVSKLGTGFLMISRKCLVEITKALPQSIERRKAALDANPRWQQYSSEWATNAWWYETDDRSGTWFDFFPMFALTDPNTGRVRQLSEDWIFCDLAHLAGIPRYLHTDVLLKHAGEKIYG